MNNNVKIAKELVKLAKSLMARNWFCDEKDYKSLKSVQNEYPSVAKIVKVTGGWQVFETLNDYETWIKQK